MWWNLLMFIERMIPSILMDVHHVLFRGSHVNPVGVKVHDDVPGGNGGGMSCDPW